MEPVKWNSSEKASADRMIVSWFCKAGPGKRQANEEKIYTQTTF